MRRSIIRSTYVKTRNTRAIMKRSKAERTPIEHGSGNVFADIGVANPEDALGKSRLAQRVCALIDQASLTQTEAGKLLGVDQARVSNLYRGRLKDFSMTRLFEFLNR